MYFAFSIEESIVKLTIVGSRDFNDYEYLKSTIEQEFENKQIELIISGGANGADKLAERYAAEHNIPTKIVYPDWKKYGKKAGPMRNEEIINESDTVLAFWDRQSRGTKSSINLSKRYKKRLIVKSFNK
jgi:hypothetical protein